MFINKNVALLLLLLIKNTIITSNSISIIPTSIYTSPPHKTILRVTINKRNASFIAGLIAIILYFIFKKVALNNEENLKENELLNNIENHIEIYKNIDSLAKLKNNKEADKFYSTIIENDKRIKEDLMSQYQVFSTLNKNIYEKLVKSNLIFDDKKYKNTEYKNLSSKIANKFEELVINLASTEKSLNEWQKLSDLFIKSDDIKPQTNYYTKIYDKDLNDYRNIINSLEIYKKLNINITNANNADLNLIISGPTGTGKTQFIEYLAMNAFSNDKHTVYYKNIQLGEIRSTFKNYSEKIIKDLQDNINTFYNKIALKDENNKNKKIVFILQFDEADSFFTKRIVNSNPNAIITVDDINTRTNAFLQMLDELNKKKAQYQTIFMLSTNHREQLDDAITRSGRFNNHIQHNYLDQNQAKEFLEWKLNEFLNDSYVEPTISEEAKKNILNNTKTMIEIEVHLKKYLLSNVMSQKNIEKIKKDEFTRENRLKLS